jgi:hypothetical protein
MALDVGHLATMGLLQPGSSGICRFPLTGISGDTRTGAAVMITMRAKVGQLILSWRRPHGDVGESDVGESDGVEVDGEQEEEIVPVELVRHPDGGHRFYFRCPGAGSTEAGSAGGSDAGESDVGESDVGCGRRVARLYFSRPWRKQRSSRTVDGTGDAAGDGTGEGRHRFLCRHCSGLVYVGPFESRRQRTLRRANRLWRHLAGAEGAAEAGAAEVAQLLAEALQAETQATEAQTAQLQRLIAWLDNRSGNRNRKPLFTLD